MPNEKEFLKELYQDQINFLNSNIAQIELRLGFDTKEKETGEPDRQFLINQIEKYLQSIQRYKQKIINLKDIQNAEL